MWAEEEGALFHSCEPIQKKLELDAEELTEQWDQARLQFALGTILNGQADLAARLRH